jgi:hypothetical protein
MSLESDVFLDYKYSFVRLPRTHLKLDKLNLLLIAVRKVPLGISFSKYLKRLLWDMTMVG